MLQATVPPGFPELKTQEMAPNLDSNLPGAVADRMENSDTSSSASTCEYGADFNAPIYPPRSQMLYDRGMVILAQAAQCFYLLWRWHRFLTNDSTLVLSLPFILSETLIVVGGAFITYFMVWFNFTRPKLRLSDMKMDRKDLPTVDVMIPCYNEPVNVSAYFLPPMTCLISCLRLLTFLV